MSWKQIPVVKVNILVPANSSEILCLFLTPLCPLHPALHQIHFLGRCFFICLPHVDCLCFSSFSLTHGRYLIIFEWNYICFKQDSTGASRLSVAAASIPLHILDFRAPETIENVAQGIRKNCPLDYACIIDVVKSSETTSGNIAFIVELLKNISTDLSDDVTREKMKVFFVSN